MTGPSLEFSLSDARPQEGRLTTADLRILIDGAVVWPVPGEPGVAVEIQIDDLLSYLTDFWKPLALRQVYPLGFKPDRPSLLRADALSRWAEQPAEVAELEDEIIIAFEEAHDLSRAFAGQFGLPAFWMMRAGETMICEASGHIWRLDYGQAIKSLTAVGDIVASRLDGLNGGQWSALIAAWRARDQGDAVPLLAWSAGIPSEMAGRFIDEGILAAPANVADAANDDDELRVAARMAGALPEDQIRRIIGLARGLPKAEAPDLDHLSRTVRDHIAIDFPNHAPFVQGEAAASFVRNAMGYASVQVVDVFAVVRGLGACVDGVTTYPANLDGLAVWGPNHGPGALINQASSRIFNRGRLEGNAGARVTLAHELCHLLLDRGHALSAVDVLGGRMPNDIERRAKAFAGEFLLPGRVAADIWFGADQPTKVHDLKPFLERLRKKYSVTLTVAAWKLDHGLRRHGIDLGYVLDLIVPGR